jgi:CBS domain-containing protein
MTDRGVGAAVVIEREKVVGIITERDVLRAVAAGSNVEETTVEDIMTRGVVSGAPGWDLIKAVKTMSERGFRHLLVMEMDEPVGIVSLRDLMMAMVEMIQPEDASA